MFLTIAFICFALVMLACLLAPTMAPKAATTAPAKEEAPIEGRQAIPA